MRYGLQIRNELLLNTVIFIYPLEIQTLWVAKNLSGLGIGVFKVKILYIEDNKTQRDIMKRMLEMLGGHQVVVAEDGKDGIKKAAESQPDIIMTDSRLPDMNGTEVIQTIRKDSALQSVPMIVLSANLMGEGKQTALEAGADGFFNKPVDYEKLTSLMEELVASKK